ncbi:MAG: energy-coupling factor transporter ATPase [Oscillospiraceae bacterium]|nr:energy-coupling factor transporter ATPase [Oscillospiraceae bacterium]
MTHETLIEFSNVSFSYDEDEENIKYAVKDLSFTVKKGEFLAVLGKNGSGKSTIAKLANSICVPSSGKVFVKGLDTSNSENEIEVRKKVGVVFQNPDNQIVASIVEEDVAFGPENLAIDPKEIRTRVDDALNAVGMYDRRFSETHRLSGGQKQRVAIAGIIAMRPECIVLDEPTAMLDPKGRADVIKTITALNKDFGVTVVLITHFMEEAINADRVMVVNDGRIFAVGTPREIFIKNDLLKGCGLELPDTAKLCEELKKSGISIKDDILTEEEFVREIVKLAKKTE